MTAAHGRSRERRETPGVDFLIDLLQRLVMLAPRREILLNLLIPGEFVSARDVRSQFGQLLRRQLIDGFFDLCKAHARMMSEQKPISSSPSRWRNCPDRRG